MYIQFANVKMSMVLFICHVCMCVHASVSWQSDIPHDTDEFSSCIHALQGVNCQKLGQSWTDISIHLTEYSNTVNVCIMQIQIMNLIAMIAMHKWFCGFVSFYYNFYKVLRTPKRESSFFYAKRAVYVKLF